MNISPTIEGGIRIDPQTPDDWHVLCSISQDANSIGIDLASRLGNLIDHTELEEDWQEIVVPDLRESFNDALHHVSAAVETAIAISKTEKESPIWVTPEEAFTWYSALNQARLAIEEHYHLGDDRELDPETLTPARFDAYLRTSFYGTLQSILLRHVL